MDRRSSLAHGFKGFPLSCLASFSKPWSSGWLPRGLGVLAGGDALRAFCLWYVSAVCGRCFCQALSLLGSRFEGAHLPHLAPIPSWQGAPMDARVEQSTS